MSNPFNTRCEIVSTSKPYVIEGVTYQPGYYWALFDYDGSAVMATDDVTYHGPYGDPCDAAFGALDAGYEPGEILAEGYIN